MALEPVDALAPKLSFFEPGQGRVEISRYWSRGPAVFVFLRHYG
jgi:hypothetical protein